jgi:DNA gyrase subunit A
MDIGSVQQVDIDEQMREAYLDYAMSVIVARALPDARDGLKPVHRRILFAMHDMGIRANSSYKKSARIVGEVLGKYHPHGDQAVYDAMARLAQEFSMRYTLVDGQGNFGSIDGDAPAAMRYTEARLDRRAEEMLVDIAKDTIDFQDNFDGSLLEPIVLPARLPNLLLNGSSGIAVGMATNVPPHNLGELVDGLNYLIDNWEKQDEVTIEELLRFIPGPDFPTGGMIVGKEGILQAYSTGRGRIILRGMAQIEEMNGNRHRIVITEIPYQLNKSSLLERIAELVREGKLDNITDLRDESDRRGMSIIVELRRGAQPKKVLNQLYKFTPLQSTFSAQVLALVDTEPRLLTLKRALQLFVEHRQEVITRRTRFDLGKARDRAHILEGLLIALAHLDEIISIIRGAPDADVARDRLMERFGLSDKQATAILDMQLRRLAALERYKIEDEQRQILEQIAYLEDLLAFPEKILVLIKQDLSEIKEQYGDNRRTRIAYDAHEDLSQEDLVADEAALISITQRGYVKRMAAKTFRAQARGGRGVTGHSTRDEDEVTILFSARTLDSILFFSDRGKVYSEKAYQIPDAERTGRGIPMVNVLALNANEKITAAVAVPAFDETHFCILATRKGRIKRLALSELASVRPSGLIALGLDEDDELGWARLTDGHNEIILVTEGGQALRFPENQVRAMGRTASGVTAMRLKKGDAITSMEVIEPNGFLMLATSGGYGKRVSLDEYPTRKRASTGIKTINQKVLKTIGRLSSAKVVQETDELTLMSASGVILRTRVADISSQGRTTRGSKVMNLGNGDVLVTIARIAEADLRKAGVEDQEPND